MIETRLEAERRWVAEHWDSLTTLVESEPFRILQALAELVAFVDALPLTTVDRHAWERLLAKLGRSER